MLLAYLNRPRSSEPLTHFPTLVWQHSVRLWLPSFLKLNCLHRCTIIWFLQSDRSPRATATVLTERQRAKINATNQNINAIRRDKSVFSLTKSFRDVSQNKFASWQRWKYLCLPELPVQTCFYWYIKKYSSWKKVKPRNCREIISLHFWS